MCYNTDIQNPEYTAYDFKDYLQNSILEKNVFTLWPKSFDTSNILVLGGKKQC